MFTKKVRGIFHNGVIQPDEVLTLPEGQLVEIVISCVNPLKEQNTNAYSLRGRFPQLQTVTDEDILVAKQMWEEGVLSQLKYLENP